MRNHIPSSPVMKQGIVTILGSDCDRNKSSASIRRTLSADMSSKKWLQQNGFFCPIKSTTHHSPSPSSSSSSSEQGEDEYDQIIPGQDEIWRSIQANKQTQQKQTVESWGSILTQKSENSLLPPPPATSAPIYVHPLAKRSLSALSERSLEVCTESLGSETGSDCLLLPSGCATERLSQSEDEVCKKEDIRMESDPFADLHVVKYKSSPVRPLPPPMASIGGAGRVHMRSRRENGRLVLEAVSVLSESYFRANREEGRLVLTMIRGERVVEEEEKVGEMFGDMEDVTVDGSEGGGGEKEEEEEEEEEVEEFVVEPKLSLSSGMISVHKSGLVMKKFVAVGNNMNATWTNKEEDISVPQSLPPAARVGRMVPSQPAAAAAVAASFNAYEYFWRNKTAVSGGFISPIVVGCEPVKNKIQNNNNNNSDKGYENRDLVVMKGNKFEQIVPHLRGCKEPRRSLLFWEPYCIATS